MELPLGDREATGAYVPLLVNLQPVGEYRRIAKMRGLPMDGH